MAEVKWIKLSIDMFDNRKIKQIRKLPGGNDIVLLWIMLLNLAGRSNSQGYIFLTENIPYTAETLAIECDLELTTVKMALELFKKFNMIEVFEDTISIMNWSEYQNLDKLESIREYQRIKKRESRKKLKLLSQGHVKDSQSESQGSQTTDIDIDIDKDIDNNKKGKSKTNFDAMINQYTENETLKETLIDFIEMRKSIKSPMTDRALKVLFTSLNKLTDNDEIKIKILEQSILKNWKGVFQLKDNNPSNTNDGRYKAFGKVY